MLLRIVDSIYLHAGVFTLFINCVGFSKYSIGFQENILWSYVLFLIILPDHKLLGAVFTLKYDATKD